MNAQILKKKIYEEDLIEELLEKMGMHHIKRRNNDEYFTCALPDGDNNVSTTVYNNERLNVVVYTRNNDITDIISLVQFTQELDFRQALCWICRALSIEDNVDFVDNRNTKTPSKKYIEKLETRKNVDDKQLNTDILIYDGKHLEKYWYSMYADVSPYFIKDNISKETQYLFGVIPYLRVQDINWCTTNYTQYDLIPIRDEVGNLKGIKARQYGYGAEKYGKYTYFLNCEKSKDLFGLYYTKNFINQQNEVIICESEKGVMQLWTYNFKNTVAVGGHNISNEQIQKIVKLGIDKVIIAFDEDITERILYTEYEKLKDLVTEVTCIIDKQHILDKKESPMDNPKKWEKLYKECQYIPKFWSDEEW